MNLTVLSDGSERIRYQNPAIPIYTVMGELQELTNMAALCHWHEDIEILLPVEGYLFYNVNGQQVFIAQGNAIVVNARHMHYGYSNDGSNCRYACITFRPQLLCANEEIKKRFVTPVLTNSGFQYLLLEQNNRAHQSLLMIVNQLIEGFSKHEMWKLGKLYEFWQELLPLSEKTESEATDTDTEILKRMLEFIRLHCSERISLAQIAASGGICRSKCCRVFNKYLNCTPNVYLNSLRLEKAMELLRATEMTVTEIAFSCGFNSASYFAESFVKEKGCTPKEYRKKGKRDSCASFS